MKKFILLVMLSTIFAVSPVTAQEETQVIKELNFTSSEGKQLTVTTDAGSVIVKGTSSSNVKVTIKSNRKDIETDMKLNAEGTSSGVSVTGTLITKRSEGTININVGFVIEVPTNYNVNVNTGGGSVKLSNVSGTQIVKTKGGSLKLENVTGNMDLETFGGSVKAENCSGDFNGTTMGGSITLKLSNGKVYATTMGGSIHLDYTGDNKGIELSTMAGSVDLSLPSDFNADLDLSTTVGRISFIGSQSIDAGNNSDVTMKLGSGGNLVKCSTSAGSINITNK